MDDHAVLGRAARCVVENLRRHDFFRGVLDVRAVIHDHRDVAGADAERGLAARITGAHVGAGAGHDDEIRLVHELGRRLFGHRRGQHLHEIARRADAREFRMYVADQRGAGRVAFRRRRQNHRIAALQRIDDVVGGGGAGIGRRHDGRDDAHRAGDLRDAGVRVFRDYAGSLRIFEIAHESERLAVILDDLVGDVAQPGVLDCQLGKRAVARGFHDCPRRRGGNFIELRLRILLKCRLRGARALHQRGNYGVRGRRFNCNLGAGSHKLSGHARIRLRAGLLRQCK